MLKRLLYRNYRLFARLDRWLRTRLTPTGSVLLGGLVGAAVFGVDTTQTTAFQIAALLFCVLLIGVAGAFAFRTRLRLRRELPDFATAGVPLHYTLHVENLSRRTQLSLSVLERLDTSLPDLADFRSWRDRRDGDNWVDRKLGYKRWLRLIALRRGANTEPVALPPLRAGVETQVRMSLLPLRRGRLCFESMLVSRPDPFGLVNAVRRFDMPHSLLVLPVRHPLPVLHLGGRRRFQPGGVNLASHVGDSREFLSLRDYRPGDPPRHIHWRSWAKTGRPIVREFQDEFFDRQALIVDTYVDEEAGETFEDAISVTASFALNDWGPDALLDLMFVGTQAVRFTAGRGLGTSANLLELLACVQPCRDRPFAVLRELVTRHAPQLSAAVLVLLSWDAARQALVGNLRANNVPVLVLVIVNDNKALPQGVMSDAPDRFFTLRAGRIREGLARLAGAGTRPAPAPRAIA